MTGPPKQTLNIVFDLTRATPFHFPFVRRITRLCATAEAVGLRPNVVALISKDGGAGTVLRKSSGLERILEIEVESADPGAWRSAGDLLGPHLSLLIPFATHVSGRWLEAGIEALRREPEQDLIIHPELGVFGAHLKWRLVSFASPESLPFAPPVMLGFGPTLSRALKRGLCGQVLFSNEPWLQRVLMAEVAIWRAVPGTAFFMEEPVQSFHAVGEFKLERPISTWPYSWLEAELKELRDLDPRIPVGAEEPARELFLGLRDPVLEKAAELDQLVPPGMRRFFILPNITDDRYGGLQKLLIQSMAAAEPGSPICAFLTESEQTVLENGPGAPISFIGIGHVLAKLDGEGAQAKALAAFLARRGAERIHLFESRLCMELAVIWPSLLFPECKVTCTVLPKNGHSLLEESLSLPEAQQEARGVRFIFFNEDSLLLKSLRAYRLNEPRVVSPGWPPQWREEMGG